ncbi:sugar phosphate isomerase/epimerase family protein [Janthinobacterium lividum]|uniref:sugar phosphate isomerase/epimerase family protein n=1 Tax=Janthinobacterium lividum TaxID=29581 RepID=UPI00087352A0|nr:sugar phosphate isomerase/epimerase [Janthinobacterium lividum]MCC7716682.1 sugar phosphate isomerase/epimerase [Janthinobacterium lividum]OEZ51809.1 inosose isomerase [Janthinobacterium lividum]WQE31752.1 sugar phosphate isomerase/epimerase [Janthinobacterium lividum]STS86023.1 Xylose isomerase-like TIM barrel [Janthinobacterium lividum]
MNCSSSPDLALAHLTVLEVPPLQLVSLAAKIGYKAIGLRLYPAFPGSVFYELPAGTTASREMQQRLQDEGIEVNDIEFIGIGEHFNARQLTGLLDAASALGARHLSVCGDDTDHSRLTANFASLCDLAAPYGMRVELEYMAWRQVKDFDDALGIVLAADKQNGGVLIDALHLWRTGGSPRDIRRAPAGTISFIQLCDAQAEPPTTPETLLQEARSGRLAPGCGALPLWELLTEVPDGTVVSLEVPSARSVDPEQHARNVFRSTQDMLAAHKLT